MTKDEALKLALEALEDLGMKHYESTGEVLYKDTFTAIKEALAQQEQKTERVTYTGNATSEFLEGERPTGFFIQADKRQPEPEYLAFMDTPQRTWVGLTDEEIRSIAKPPDDIEIPMTGRMWIFVGDLMDKLKEKNS